MRFALLLITIPLWGQLSPAAAAQTSDQNAVKPADFCQLEGRVVDAQTGEPVKNVRLVLRQVGGRDLPSDTSSNASGAFAMKDLTPGRYRLSAEKNGYVRQEYGMRSSQTGVVLALSPGQQLKDIVFRLIPQGVISGRVVDADGEPLANVRLTALKPAYVRGKRRLTPAGMATSNDLGEYRLFGLSAGRYLVSAAYNPVSDLAAAVDRTATEANSREGYALTFYPGGSDPRNAAPVDVNPGNKISGISFTLVKTPMVRIRGRVVNSAESEGAGGTVIVNLSPHDAGSLGRRTATVRDAKGGFEFRTVAAGSYTLTATSFAGSKRYAASRQLDVSSQNLDDVRLDLNGGRDLAGVIKIEGQTPANLNGIAVFIESRDADSLFSGIQGRAGQDGRFILPNVTDGEYNIDVTGLPEELYIKSMRMGRDDVLESGLNVSGGAAGGALDVTLSADGGTIDGGVQNEETQPVAGARVVLVPDEGRRNRADLYKSAATDQYGRFTLKGIAPGDYKLFAWEEVEAEAYQDPDFLKDFEKSGEAIAIREKDRSSKQLKVIPSTAGGAAGQKAQSR